MLETAWVEIGSCYRIECYILERCLCSLIYCQTQVTRGIIRADEHPLVYTIVIYRKSLTLDKDVNGRETLRVECFALTSIDQTCLACRVIIGIPVPIA